MVISSWLKLACGALSAAIIALAVAGGILHFSSVPHMDMWNGALDALRRMDEGDASVWWAQHNEHRILISRGLFWLEYTVFDGSGAFLIFLNYAFVALAAGLLTWALLRTSRGEGSRTDFATAFLAVLALLCLWTQHENLTWAFQSQFFLAQTLPLAALLLLARSKEASASSGLWFAGAVVVGLASTGTMANALLVQPLLVVCAAALRMGWARTGILCAAAAFSFWAYLYNYVSHPGHGSVTATLVSDPVGLVIYTLRYLGSPVYGVFGPGTPASVAAAMAGLVLMLATLAQAIRILWSAKPEPFALALILFIAYVCGTALVTGGGRLVFGLDQAFSSRYTTPALMAWAALIVLYAPLFIRGLRHHQTEGQVFLALTAAALGFLVAFQTAAIRPDQELAFRREIAALSIELDIPDETYIRTVFPNTAAAMSIGRYASGLNRGVFGTARFRDVAQRIGSAAAPRDTRVCSGSLDRIEPIAGVHKWVRFHGWQFDDQAGRPPSSVDLVDQAGQVVGYGLTGQPRPDVAGAIDPKALRSGFAGYVRAGAIGQPLSVQGGGCRTQGQLEVAIFVPVAGVSAAEAVTARADIVANEGWAGGDYYATSFEGLVVLGSYVDSDADVGVLKVRLRPGERLLYRSGPTGGRQLVRLEDDAGVFSVLPVATEWTLLELSGNAVTGDSHVFEFADEGDGWGEWSAIALLPAP